MLDNMHRYSSGKNVCLSVGGGGGIIALIKCSTPPPSKSNGPPLRRLLSVELIRHPLLGSTTPSALIYIGTRLFKAGLVLILG